MLTCCFGRQTQRSASAVDPFSGITADQERSRRVLRLRARPGDSPTHASSALERVHAMEEQIAAGGSRQSSRASARAGRGAVECGSFASLGSTMRNFSRNPSNLEGPVWVDHAWDSLVRGRVLASDGPPSYSGTVSDDDNVSFRSLAVAMQSQMVVTDFDDYADDRSVSSTHSVPWDDIPHSSSPMRRPGHPGSPSRGMDDDPSAMAPMSRLQMLAEDPFLEDLSLENLSLNHSVSRSNLDDAYSPPATTTISARGSLPRPTSPELAHHSGPPSTTSYYDSEPSSAFSLTLDRGLDDRVDGNAKKQSAPSSVSSTTTVRALRLEDILNRNEGVEVLLAEKEAAGVLPATEVPVAVETPLAVQEPGPVADDSDDSDAASIEWRTSPTLAASDTLTHDDASSGSESATTMYTAPAEMLSTKTFKSNRILSNTDTIVAAEGLLAEHADNNDDNSSYSGEDSPEASSPNMLMASGQSAASLADTSSIVSGATSGVGAMGCGMSSDDFAYTEFSYITEEAKSTGARSTKSSRSFTGSKLISTVPECITPERRTRKSMIRKLGERFESSKKTADASLVSRHMSAPVVQKSPPRDDEEPSDDDDLDGPSVRDLRRMWSERARVVTVS